MKRYILYIAMITIFLNACSEKYECEHSIYYLYPTDIAFKGFDADDLDSVIIERYKINGYPDHKISVDTILTTPYFEGDTAFFSITNNLIRINDSTDLRVVLPGITDFLITGAQKGDKTIERWVEDTPCSPGAGSAVIRPLENIHVNGKAVGSVASEKSSGSYFIYLQQ